MNDKQIEFSERRQNAWVSKVSEYGNE